MKIAVAQTKPIKGDIQSNIENHKKLIELAVAENADMIIFPELSITGYEPELAKELATDIDDSRLNVFQEISDNENITIGVGMPLKSNAGILISMILFQPKKQRQTYSKQYLHPDEFPFFVHAEPQPVFYINNTRAAFAICYELSVPAHSEDANKNNTEIYIASVAKTASGVEKAEQSLSAIAKKYSIPVLFSNCAGHCDNFDSGGKTSAWNRKGELIAQLNDTNEGIIIMDTVSEEVIEKIYSKEVKAV